jgi:hypothetical protein
MANTHNTAASAPEHQPESRRGFLLSLQLTCPYCGHTMTHQVEVCPGTFPPPRFVVCGDDNGHGCYQWYAIRSKLHIEASIETFKLGEQDVGDDPDGDCAIQPNVKH